MSEQIVNLDKHGDIRVQLPPSSNVDSASYIVCSRALARVSPVLRSEIYQYLARDSAEHPHMLNELVMQLEAHDHDSLTIFLDIAHAHFSRLPQTMDICQIYHLSTLASRYHCTEILFPWIYSWIAAAQGEAGNGNAAMQLGVFGELGLKPDFINMARSMLVKLEASEFRNSSLTGDNTRLSLVIGTMPLQRVCFSRRKR